MKAMVLGSGGWGTALALLLCDNGHAVSLWSHNPEKAEAMRKTRENPLLSGVPLPEELEIVSDIALTAEADLVVFATPSFALRETARRAAPYLRPEQTLVSVTKGIERDTNLRMSEVLRQETGDICKVVSLSGPSHAEEVGRRLPTGCVAACPDEKSACLVQDAFMNGVFRVYTSPDIVGVELSAAVFLNIGYDHISPIEHPDFEDYFTSKLKIFAQARICCVNLDCDHADRVLEAARKSCPRMITFSQKDPSATIFGSQVRKVGGDILFRVKTPRFSREFRLTMPGLFNVQNALAAIAVCEGLNIPERAVYVGLMKARVPGRMEVYANADEKVTVIVDYAHNRLSFETLFQSVREEYPGRRIVTVFGCPGYKAYDRRKDLGEISGQYSDLVILTEEDAGEEPVEEICRDIAQYVEQGGCDYSIVPDRGEAVRQAVMGCQVPTVILLTGKGAETRQKRGIEYIDCPSDVDYAKEYLHEYDVQHGMDGMSKVRALLDVLPLLRRYEGRTIVIKYGGSALDAASTDTILEDAAALQSVGVRVILVHGGGKEISALLERLQVETHFENGYRVTDQTVLEMSPVRRDIEDYFVELMEGGAQGAARAASCEEGGARHV